MPELERTPEVERTRLGALTIVRGGVRLPPDACFRRAMQMSLSACPLVLVLVRTRRERGRCSDARSACKAQAETLPVDTLERHLTAPSPPTSPQKVPTSDS